MRWGSRGLSTKLSQKIQIITNHHDDAVLAMILNGFGFHSRTLRVFSGFFETKPVSKLLAKNIEAHHLTSLFKKSRVFNVFIVP